MASEAARHYGNPAEPTAQRASADDSDESHAFRVLTIALGFYLLVAVVLLRVIYRLSRSLR